MPDTAPTRRRRHPDEIAPRPAPLHLVSMASADEFLADGDIGLSVGEGHFPARVIQRVTGSPYVHTLGIQKVADVWTLVESKPPSVCVRPLAELVSEASGLYDIYRLAPGPCDLNAAWAWAVRAEGVGYSYRDLWLVWRRRYRQAVERGECKPFAFLSQREFCRSRGEELPVMASIDDPYWNENEATVGGLCGAEQQTGFSAGRIPAPVPNSDLPDGCKRDCSALWGAALRVAGLVPPIMEWDCDCVPGDFAGLEYVVTLI